MKMGTEKAAGMLTASITLHYTLMFALVTFKVLPLISLLAALASAPIAACVPGPPREGETRIFLLTTPQAFPACP